MHGPLMILAVADGFTDPLGKYFSFIVLGLMMCIGYAIIRIVSGKKKDEENRRKGSLEEMLAGAEREAWEQARNRRQGEEADALALPPEEEKKRAALARMVAEQELKQKLEQSTGTAEGEPKK